MSDEITVELLKNVSLFNKLEDSDIEKITKVVQKGTISAGTEFFKEGDTGDAFYVLTQGEVEVSKIVDGKKVILKNIKSSDDDNFFGEMALIEDLPRNATIVSKTECEILQIEKKDFDILLKINSFVSLKIVTAITKRLRADTQTTPHTDNAAAAKPLSAQIISFFSPKGGSGKTSLAINTAYGIAKYLNKKVLLIDLDLQFGSIAFILDLKVKKTIADLVDGMRCYDDIKACTIAHKSGFSLLPSPLKPEQSENIDSNHLRKILSLCKDQYDYILIDTHSLLQDISINALDLSDQIMLVMNPDMANFAAIHNCLKVMDSLKYPKEKVHIILNRFDIEQGKSKEELSNALQKDNEKIDYLIHNDIKVVSNLINNCQTVFDSEEQSEYRSDIVNLINDITKEKLPPEAGKTGGIFAAIKNWFNS